MPKFNVWLEGYEVTGNDRMLDSSAPSRPIPLRRPVPN
jgi:hypothetical protein